jgi:hypothetical protein
MTKEMHRALQRKGYTADEIELLLESFTELLDKLRREATWNRFAYRCTIRRRIRHRS